MGAHHSKRPDTPSVLLDDGGGGGGKADIRYVAELSSYEAACRLDPELQGFDSTLQRCTSRVISSLALGVEVRSLSLDSLREITGCLLEMNQEVVKVILECKSDIWKTPELFGLVEDYFENSLHTLDFCAALEKCLKKARDGQLIIQVALQHFAEEEAEPEPEPQKDAKKKYSRTLEELRLFKAAGDPFTEEFFQVFQSVHGQQLLMLEKLQQRKNKLDKQLRSIKAWRRVSSTIFAATFAAVLICSVVAAAVAAPPVAAALAAAASIPIGSMGKWIDSLLHDYQNAVKGQREVLRSMQVGTYVAIKDMESIRVLIDKVEMEMASLLADAEFAMEDAQAVSIAMEEIKKKVEVFMRSVEEVGEQADGCSRDIRRARTVVLQRIIRNPE
ncbi:UPF0496 protein 1-like [Musa acuminata AAA Group]|uniref:Uncharacterized protein n=1 Tax=Musa acuminata subsp. malaccensis TaxID=214687 RepID=A0A804HUM9_MUSAM|nr:PREDICTED: UPF0496 protein 1-like [Musa acuminata subsp. malaccensis]